MAPLPPADLPLGQRLARLAQTLQCTHATLIVCIFRYSLSWLRFNYYSGMAQFCYRLTFLSAAATYGIVVYKTWRARQKTGARQPGPLGFLSDENIQYLLMAIVWLFMPQYPLAMLPYGIYSVFHVATYTRANLIPTVIPPTKVPAQAGASPNAKPQYAQHPLSDAIGSFVKKYYDSSMSIVSGLEIVLWIRLLLGAILFQRRSWILLAVYTAFLRARFAQSTHVQNSFAQFEARIDNLIGAQGTPPAARQVWDGVKNGARQFHAATDVNKYIVAGPRAKHEETGLDLCYVTSKIIATSGPSQTYPQRAYRNPLDRLVSFLDAKHGDGWAIWEFRAEGTGYPDEAVYNRIRHYPWPDHHPPPFRLVPMIMASMRNWLAGGELDGSGGASAGAGKKEEDGQGKGKEEGDNRVVVVHCKAGKGRSGSMACSFLISERGWKPKDALARFTERRMRPKFGAGVSIPSQLRWISYVDRWTRGGKVYVDRPVEIVEVHVWGLRHGVKVAVEGFAEEGKRIEVVHTFSREERILVEGDAPGGSGFKELVSDMAKYGLAEREDEEIVENSDYEGVVEGRDGKKEGEKKGDAPSRKGSTKSKGSRASSLMRKISTRKSSSPSPSLSKLSTGTSAKSKTIAIPSADAPKAAEPAKSNSTLFNGTAQSRSASNLQDTFSFADPMEPGGQAVIFKPSKAIIIDNGDVNITIERRNRAPASLGLTMVTATAHVWFNTFFEGNGPEQEGKADDSGVFEIEWDKLDGIKGSSQKGTRACDRLSVVWRVPGTSGDGTAGPEVRDTEGNVITTAAGVTIHEPGVDSPVPQMEPADWKGAEKDPVAQKHLGLRTEAPESESVSKASSLRSEELEEGGDDDSLKGVKISGPMGEDVLDAIPIKATDEPSSAEQQADKTAKKGFIIE
ncbi:nucleoporin POM33 [Podospora aff. communis PSN243]|uniref:phosphatidylinositol-3,4,5-trisphosphate 3-phosphatase n=1 Tax=Podospora aff. communis PSN243 TaxID=3040156 RepID=A0AAV9GIW2_9PEZI|nr:nucleoporin POM33 [Podospora aff. communis PSN243]